MERHPQEFRAEPITPAAVLADDAQRQRKGIVVALAGVAIWVGGLVVASTWVEPWLASFGGGHTWPRAILATVWLVAAFAGAIALGARAPSWLRVRCPKCNARLAEHKSYVLMTGLCPACFTRIFSVTPARPRGRRPGLRRLFAFSLAGPAWVALLAVRWLTVHGLANWRSMSPKALAALFALAECPTLLMAASAIVSDRLRRQRLALDAPSPVPYPSLMVLRDTPRDARGTYKLYSRPDAWCLVWLGPSETRGCARARLLADVIVPRFERELVERRRREASYDTADLDGDEWLTRDPRNLRIPRSVDASWSYRPGRFTLLPAQVGVLTVPGPNGVPLTLAVIAPLTPDEVEAAMRGNGPNRAAVVFVDDEA